MRNVLIRDAQRRQKKRQQYEIAAMQPHSEEHLEMAETVEGEEQNHP